MSVASIESAGRACVASTAEDLFRRNRESEVDIAVVIVSAATAALVSIIVSILERRAKIDEAIRERRIPLYKDLWLATGRLPMWPKDKGVTYRDVLKLSVTFRGWYFDQHGGMFLSTAARRAYEGVQVAITEIVAQRAKGDKPDIDPLLPPDYESVQKACSALRTQLTRDLTSRRGPGGLSIPSVAGVRKGISSIRNRVQRVPPQDPGRTSG